VNYNHQFKKYTYKTRHIFDSGSQRIIPSEKFSGNRQVKIGPTYSYSHSRWFLFCELQSSIL